MGRWKRPCPLPVQSRVNRVLAVIANRKRITKETSVRFDRRPSVNSAYRPTSSFVRTPHGQLEPVFPSRRTGICRFGRSLRKTGRIPDVFGSAQRRRCRLCNATIVNGSAGARRCARPVRITLARVLGGDIDGAWWPHSASVAGELPELIGALQPASRRDRRHQNQLVPNRCGARSGLDGSRRPCRCPAGGRCPAGAGDANV